MTKRIGIVGGSGFVGGELLRILSYHDGCEIASVSSRRLAGKSVVRAHPHLIGKYDSLNFVESAVNNFLDCDFAFIVSPAGEISFEYVEKFSDAGIKAVDTTACYRTTPEDFEKYYGKLHEDKKRKLLYGLPEINRDEIKNSQIVSNPGCIAASCILTAKPLDDEKLVESASFDAKVSISCAGAEPYERTHFPFATENVYQYEAEKMPHRQTPEIKNNLSFPFVFIPHLVPIVRGVLVTSYLKLVESSRPDRLKEILKKRYGREKFVRFVDRPATTYVKNSNFFDLGNFYYSDEMRTLVISSAVDNLIKGSAGQAIQNMNLMLGFDEEKGLNNIPIFP